MEIKTNRLKLAQVRFFSEKHNGVEIPEKPAYAFLVKLGEDNYFNPFNLEREYPVYDRTFYAQCDRNGNDYGTIIRLVSGEVKSGPCYVLEKKNNPLDFTGFGRLCLDDSVSIEKLEEYMLSSDLFFIDRVNILEKMDLDTPQLQRKFDDDGTETEKFEQYLIHCMEEEKQSQK